MGYRISVWMMTSRGFLNRLRSIFTNRLLFSENADGDLARRVRGKQISGHRGYWLPHSSNGAADTFAGLPSLGEVGPLQLLPTGSFGSIRQGSARALWL